MYCLLYEQPHRSLRWELSVYIQHYLVSRLLIFKPPRVFIALSLTIPSLFEEGQHLGQSAYSAQKSLKEGLHVQRNLRQLTKIDDLLFPCLAQVSSEHQTHHQTPFLLE